MTTITTTFAEVKITGTKTGKCFECGKRCSRTREFFQTLNPFNKNKDGSIKTRSQIMDELIVDRKKWMAEPVIMHAKCEPSPWDKR